MGNAAEGILVYGTSLGGEVDGWKIQNVDGWGEWRPSWLKPAEDDPEEYAEADYVKCAMEALLAAAGFVETDWDALGYYERKEAAERRVGVSFVRHGHYKTPQLILSTFSIDVTQSRVKGIDPDIIATAPTELWDSRIQDALNVLGIKPVQEKPCWLLTASYG